MNRIMVFALCTMLLLAGCGKSDFESTPANAQPQATATAQATAQPTAEPVNEEKSEATPTPQPTEAPEAEEEKESKEAEEKESDSGESSSYNVSGKVIVIDAGHGINSSTEKEAMAPGSSEMKRAFVSGTSGANQTEEELNLAVAFKLQEELESRGAIVHMTRTGHQTDKSNIGRAEFANDLGADISVKIHADGIENSSVHGVSVLVPGDQYISDDSLIQKSKTAGNYVLDGIVEKTGAPDRGISVRNDMTGFNWSTVPVILVEMGFMTNPEEDRLMETDEYQTKIVGGIADGLEEYFGE